MEEEITALQPGERLRQAREARELSVADVSANLKLSAEKIRALEAGDIEDLAAPVFVAGYLRAYAKLLELPEEEVLNDFAHLMPEPESIVEPPEDEANAQGNGAAAIKIRLSADKGVSGHHALVIGLVVIVGLIYFLWPSSANKPRRTNENAVQSVEPAVVQEQTKTDMGSASLGENETATDAGQDTKVEEGLDQADNAEVSIEVPAEQEPAAEPIATFDALAVGMKSELSLVFSEDSWVEVTDARDQRLVYRLGKAGSTRAITGVAPFVVQLGYAPGVNIFYNGEAYDMSPYANRRSVRLRIGEAGDRMGGG